MESCRTGLIRGSKWEPQRVLTSHLFLGFVTEGKDAEQNRPVRETQPNTTRFYSSGAAKVGDVDVKTRKVAAQGLQGKENSHFLSVEFHFYKRKTFWNLVHTNVMCLTLLNCTFQKLLWSKQGVSASVSASCTFAWALFLLFALSYRYLFGS